MEKLAQAEGLRTNFYTFEGVVKALNGVSLVVNNGETYGLVGESGCGKSVSVRSMMRIVQAPGRIEEGKVVLYFSEKDKTKGIDIIQRSEAYMQSIRGNDISMIFQEASTALNPVLSIGFQVGESFLLHRRDEMVRQAIQRIEKDLEESGNPIVSGWKNFHKTLLQKELNSLEAYNAKVAEIDNELYLLEGKEDQKSVSRHKHLIAARENLKKLNAAVRFQLKIPVMRRYYKRIRKEVKENVIELLTSLGIPNPRNIVNRYPHELSGGMQQRIVIAIALACHPTLLIADEPTSNLDVTIQAQILDLIKKLKQTKIASVLFITHDLGIVAEICDRVTVMYAGDACETTSVKELFKNPLHPYTKGLLNSVPKADQVEKLQTIPGTVPNLITPPSGCRFHPRCPLSNEKCTKEEPPLEEKETGHWARCWNMTMTWI